MPAGKRQLGSLPASGRRPIQRAMSAPPHQPSSQSADPFGWTALVTGAFLLLVLIRLGIPSKPFFDEVHYLPAARALLEMSQPLNREHPMLGKELISLGMAIFGDRPFGWRALPALFGALALFAFMRAMWHVSLSRFATIAGGVLLATAFPLFVHARIAMLDIFVISFIMVAFWMCASALRKAETARWRLGIAGGALGCAMASKWSAIPVAVVPGLAFLAIRLRSTGWRAWTSSRGWPVPGIGLPEAFLWLGAVPLATYAATYLPAIFFAQGAFGPLELANVHRLMLDLQTQPLAEHTYQSRWWQWVGNIRAIWYLYEVVDEAQRGVLLVGNPLTMLAGLPALAWCLWSGIARGNAAGLAVAVLYAASIGLWLVAAKNVQFYYHYFLPSCFLVAALTLALDALWQAGWRKTALAPVAGALALFAFFYPILSAAPLDGAAAFERWTWLGSWR